MTNMKKAIAVLSLFALALTASPVFAKDRGHDENNEHAKFEASSEHHVKLNIVDKFFNKSVKNDRFVVLGTVSSLGDTSFVMSVDRGVNASGSITVVVNGDTKIGNMNHEEDNLAFANLSVGAKVLVKGEVSDNTFTAQNVKIIDPAAVQAKLDKKQIAVGSVTAKTDTSLTIKNSLTGVEKTIVFDPETEVKINNELKAVADIQVGDKGWVKFKTDVNVFVAKVIKLFR